MASFSVFIGANKAEMFFWILLSSQKPSLRSNISNSDDGNGKFDRFDRVSKMSRFRL